jgi:ceramide glucosyltransferase
VNAFFSNAAACAVWFCYGAAAAGCLYALAAAAVAARFQRTNSAPAFAGAYPPVTVLKPLHGGEADLYRNLASFCVQDYPGPLQIVCGVADAGDPAVAVVRRLIADFPDRDIALVINARRHGSNGKISNLINMMAQARHDVFVVSDSDIVVEADYLKDVTACLAQPGVGLVTCLYRGVAAGGLWSKLAASGINYHFLPNVLVGLKLGLATPCFGSTMALSRQSLAAIGGFEAVADQLADDYLIGALVRSKGLKVAIAPAAVTHVCAEQSAAALFRHELRWARTIRLLDPAGFAGLLVTHAMPLALLGAVFGGLSPAALLVVLALGCRLGLHAALDRAFHLRDDRRRLSPLRDLLSFAVFIASFFGRRVEWRGHHYGMHADNTLAYYGEVKT